VSTTAPGGAVVGIITTSDLITVLLQQLPSTDEYHAAPAESPGQLADPDELARAVSAAELRHRRGDDPERLAATVLYLNAKTRQLDAVLHAADLYLHSGQGSHEHGQLVKAISRANETLRPDLKAGRL